MLWVWLAGWTWFVAERFADACFDLGVPYPRVPTFLAWLFWLPFGGYWFGLVRSPLLGSWQRAGRGAVLAGVSLALAGGLFYASGGVFWTVASRRGVQWW